MSYSTTFFDWELTLHNDGKERDDSYELTYGQFSVCAASEVEAYTLLNNDIYEFIKRYQLIGLPEVVNVDCFGCQQIDKELL